MRRRWAAGAAITVCLALGGLPVGGQSPTPGPAGGVHIEVLSDRAVIPLEALPSDTDHAALWRDTRVPGMSATYGSFAPKSWAQVSYVLHGTATATDNAKERGWLPDGSIEDVAAGTEFSLRAGETWLSYNGGAGFRFENGPEPFVVLSVGVGDNLAPAVQPAPVTGETTDLFTFTFPPRDQLQAWLSAPIAVTFQRVTLDPGASLVLETEDIPMLTFTGVESGSVRWGHSSSAEPDPQMTGSVMSEGMAAYRSTPGSDRVVVVANAAEEPAVLLQAVLSPASE